MGKPKPLPKPNFSTAEPSDSAIPPPDPDPCWDALHKLRVNRVLERLEDGDLDADETGSD